MSTFVSTIKHVESEFNDIYRITTENGLILDIPETKMPEIGTEISYQISSDHSSDHGFLNSDYTIMNGTVFNTNNVGILVSFGGLLGTIPMDESARKLVKEEISLCYKLNCATSDN
jgi:hypothetical protein